MMRLPFQKYPEDVNYETFPLEEALQSKTLHDLVVANLSMCVPLLFDLLRGIFDKTMRKYASVKVYLLLGLLLPNIVLYCLGSKLTYESVPAIFVARSFLLIYSMLATIYRCGAPSLNYWIIKGLDTLSQATRE